MVTTNLNWIYCPETWKQNVEASFSEGARYYRKNNLDASQESRDVILDTLHAYGQSLARQQFRQIAGLSFLIFWLQRRNLERLLNLNFGSRLEALEKTTRFGDIAFRAAGRGLVCHWVAGNVATLSIFSWAMAALTNNRSLIRISSDSQADATLLFGALRDLGTPVPILERGKQFLLSNLAVVHFEREQIDFHAVMSEIADVRMIWGGNEVIQTVTKLPRLDYAEDLIFGPKLSIALMDNAALSDHKMCSKFCRALATDIVAFDQSACSSPQFLFIESPSIDECSLKEMIDTLSLEIERAGARLGKTLRNGQINMNIFSARAEYAMKEIGMVRCGNDFQFSILIDDELTMKTVIQHRSLYVKVFQKIEQVVSLISPKIQTVGLGVLAKDKLKDWQDMLVKNGVARCVPLGTMNFFEHPWDGFFPLDRLVRWSRVTPVEP